MPAYSSTFKQKLTLGRVNHTSYSTDKLGMKSKSFAQILREKSQRYLKKETSQPNYGADKQAFNPTLEGTFIDLTRYKSRLGSGTKSKLDQYFDRYLEWDSRNFVGPEDHAQDSDSITSPLETPAVTFEVKSLSENAQRMLKNLIEYGAPQLSSNELSLQQLKSGFRFLAKTLHPDLNPEVPSFKFYQMKQCFDVVFSEAEDLVEKDAA